MVKSLKVSDNAQKVIFRGFCFLLPLFVSFLVIKYNKNMKQVTILSDEFMINFLLVVLGVGITILTAVIFVYIKDIRNGITKVHELTIKRINVETNIERLLKSLKEDVFALLLFVIVVSALSIYKSFDIPNLVWKFSILSKDEFILMVKLYLGILTFIVIGDITATMFGLLQTSEELAKGIAKLAEIVNIKKRWFGS